MRHEAHKTCISSNHHHFIIIDHQTSGATRGKEEIHMTLTTVQTIQRQRAINYGYMYKKLFRDCCQDFLQDPEGEDFKAQTTTKSLSQLAASRSIWVWNTWHRLRSWELDSRYSFIWHLVLIWISSFDEISINETNPAQCFYPWRTIVHEFNKLFTIDFPLWILFAPCWLPCSGG